MIQFNLSNKTHQFNLGYGDYRVYIVGGFTIENFEFLKVRLIEVDSGKQIHLKEYNFKPRDLINGKRAIACYSFWIDRRTEYEIEFDNFELLEMKRSMLFFKNLISPTKVDLKDIEVVIK